MRKIIILMKKKKIIQNSKKDLEEDKNNEDSFKNKKIQSHINLSKNDFDIINSNNIGKLNKINTALIKNCVFNNNIAYTQRNNKFFPTPFNFKIDKLNNINTNDINNINSNQNNNIYNKEKNSIQNNINNNAINSKNMDEIDTQISTNNNIPKESLAFYQFRPRKMSLPKTVINLSSMQFNNKILQNILNKRKQKK